MSSGSLGLFDIGGDSYMVVLGDAESCSVLYKKMGGSKKMTSTPYEVGYDSSSNPYCTCKGHRFHPPCKHVRHFEEFVAPKLLELNPLAKGAQKRWPREDLAEAATLLIRRLTLPGRCAVVAGSFRRESPTVRDLDIVTTATREEILGEFEDDDLDLTVEGDHVIRFDIGADVSFQVDITMTDNEHFGAALLYLTGNKDFNIYLRVRAKAMGLKLSRNGLVSRTTGELVAALTEDQIFRAMSMTLVAPTDREDQRWLNHKTL